MAYQPKSYRKFLAGTVSAAVVASAIAPVASASFTDVAGSVHADDIATLVAKGYIKGYADGTFKPNKPLTRGEAAIIFSRILKDAGVKAPEQGAGFPDVPASKAELAEAVAIVKAAGVMGGDEKGNFNPNANITREQMAKVVVEAFKLTKPANYTTKITDLDKAGSWAREYIQTLEANGVTKNTEFAPKQNVTRGQFASFVVRAMNVKKEVSAADITAVKLVDEKTLEVTFNGELKEVKKEDFAIQGVEIESVSIKAAAAAEAKTTVVVIKTKTALQEGKSYSVSYKGQTTDKAKVNVPVVTPKVESVSANNLKNIVVKFNREVEKKTITSSNVKVYDGNTLLSGVTLNLLDDNKTLLITNNGSYSQLKEYKVVVENVEVKGDSTKKVEKAEKTVSVVDTTLPTVESVTATSPKTLEIVFSEPIQTGSGAGQFPTSAAVLTDIVQIDGINAYATPTLTDIDTKNKVVLTLNTPLTAGEHKIKVANLKDYANLPIAAKEFTVNIPADTTAPEVTAVEVLNKDKVKVTFNEPVDNATVQSNLANIKVNGTAVTAATAKEGGKVYELTLGSSLNLAAVVEAKLEYKGIKDNYGNEVKDAKTFIFKAVDDTTAPTVTDVKVNSDNTIEVTFSEDVTGFTGTNTVELYDKDNKKLSNTVTVAKKVIDGVPSDKVYVLTITDGSSLSGAHTIKILKDNVTDLSIRKNKFAEATFPVTLNDKVAPTITKVEYVNETAGTDFNSDADVKDSKVTIYFSEAMDVATLTNKANYLINRTPLADVPGTVTLTPAGDNKSVTITVNRGSSDTQLTFANNTDLRVIAVKDAAGNTLSSTQVNANLGKAGLISKFEPAPAFTEAVDKVEVISKNQLKLYAKSGYLFSGIDANKIKFTENKKATALIPGLQVTAVSIAADGKTATLTLNNNVTADGKFDGSDADTVANVVSLYADADAITLTNGAKTAALVATSGLNVIDKTAPSISTVTKHATNADTIVLTFDEPVSFSNSVGLAGDLVVKLADGTVLNPAAGDYTVADSVSGDEKLEIKIVKPGVKDANVTVELKDGRYITDSASNVATTFTVKDVMDRDNKARITEKTAPTKAVTADSDWSTPGQVTIKFSEPVKGFTIEDITAVKASTKETLAFGTGASVTAVDPDSNGYATTWVVNFGKDAAVALATVDTVRVDATKVLDLAGNPAGTTGEFITFTAKLPIAAKEFTVNIPADTTAPEVTAVEVLNKDKVKVTFNEPVDNATVQSNLANIKVNGTAVTAATAKEGGKVYELTLGSSLNLAAVVEAKLEYKGIKDNYGNEVKDAKTFIFKAVDDTTAPTVTDVKVNSDNTIEVTFSEDVTGFTGTNTVELYDKDNKKLSNTVTVAKKVIDGVPSDKVYVLTITDGSSLSGAHTIKILKDNVTDLSIRKNKFAEATFSVTLNDKVAPTITKVEYVNETAGTDFNSDADVKDSKVTIYFSEAMDVATLTNKANYLINSTPLADVPGTVTLTPAGDNKSVTITVNRGSSDTQLTFANNTDLRVIAVKDAAGNTLSSTQVNANLGEAGLISEFVSAPAFTTAVDKVEVISKNQLKLYAKSGYLFSGIDASKIKFTENRSATALIPGLQVTAVSIAADGKTATLTLNNNVTTDGKFDGSDADTVANVVSLYADADAITLTNGAKTAALEATRGLNVIDKTAPTKAVTANSDWSTPGQVTIKFSEPVKGFTIEDITAVKPSTKETLTFGTGASVAAVDSDSNGYATTWVVNFGKDADVTLATVDTVRVDATKVLDLAGNPAGTTGEFITFTAKQS
ncbi:hypothetical protein HPJ99_03100 [Anoxybacillus flavithermus]|uniref:S-layer homology domain-containing protein n=1 Tax=Anoxybacillus flavithermus TaxID=33934 RepID=UPI0018667BC8|nr:S-layer homology domain-containing protein [Anoxybacillus flavithermus]MBE2934226.1 hypothetical protein [Anoxybacillus flavithermus]